MLTSHGWSLQVGSRLSRSGGSWCESTPLRPRRAGQLQHGGPVEASLGVAIPNCARRVLANSGPPLPSSHTITTCGSGAPRHSGKRLARPIPKSASRHPEPWSILLDTPSLPLLPSPPALRILSPSSSNPLLSSSDASYLHSLRQRYISQTWVPDVSQLPFPAFPLALSSAFLDISCPPSIFLPDGEQAVLVLLESI